MDPLPALRFGISQSYTEKKKELHRGLVTITPPLFSSKRGGWGVSFFEWPGVG
jgi:hypothetical protein